MFLQSYYQLLQHDLEKTLSIIKFVGASCSSIATFNEELTYLIHL